MRIFLHLVCRGVRPVREDGVSWSLSLGVPGQHIALLTHVLPRQAGRNIAQFFPIGLCLKYYFKHMGKIWHWEKLLTTGPTCSIAEDLCCMRCKSLMAWDNLVANPVLVYTFYVTLYRIYAGHCPVSTVVLS